MARGILKNKKIQCMYRPRLYATALCSGELAPLHARSRYRLGLAISIYVYEYQYICRYQKPLLDIKVLEKIATQNHNSCAGSISVRNRFSY